MAPPSSPSAPAPAPFPPAGKRVLDRVTPRRTRARRPDPPGLRVRFTDRDRDDVPEIDLQAGEVTLIEATASTEAIRHRLVLDCATRGRSLIHIVGGNRLDSTALARRAQAEGLDPGYVLRSSQIARAFTAYQLSVLIEERLPAALARDEELALAIVSDPLALYTDEDVRAKEGRTLAGQAFEAIEEVAEEAACPVLVLQSLTGRGRPKGGRPAPGRRKRKGARDAALLASMRACADTRVRFGALEDASRVEGGSVRVVSVPDQDRAVRWADPRAVQTRLDRFSETEDEAVSGQASASGRASVALVEGLRG